MKPTDAIIGPSRGTAAKAKASFRARGAQRIDDVDDYVDTVYELCAPDDMPDAAIVVSAADVETGTFSNHWWKTRLNAGSLGVTGWGPDDEKSPTFTTGGGAAIAHVAHLLLYATGQINRGGLEPSDDPRFAAYRAAYGSQAFPTLNGLSGRYAADTGYAATIAARSRSIYGELPDQGAVTEPPKEQPPMAIEYGLVPHPAFQDRPITKQPGRGMDNLGKRSVKGVVWHRILGSLWGTDGYFRQANVNALTDYGVGVAATDGASNDGVILRWNNPLGYQSGWASGRVIAPWGDGLAFVNKYGVNAVNRDQASIEISGQYATPLTEASRQAIAALTAYWADQYRIPWDVFPIAPQDGFSFVRWHQEFTGPQEKVCPGEVVMRETADLIERVRAILKKYQTAGTSPQPQPDPEPEPEPQEKHTLPPGMSRQLAARLFGTYRAPWDGTLFAFDLRSAPSQVWLARGKRSIPEGKSWAFGDWPSLDKIIRRGDGGQVWVWSDGSTYERDGTARDAA